MHLRTLLVAAVLLVPGGASADEGDAMRARLEAVAPSIAVVKCVLHMQWSSEGVPGDNETLMDGRAAVVDPSGILLVSGPTVGAETEAQRTWRRENVGAQMKLTAENLRVILPPDATEHPAAVLLMDARLELAFVQVLDLGTTKLPAVDLTQGAPPRLGQTLVGVTRDTEGYGHAPGIWTLYPAGRLEKPASMWLAAGNFNQVGLPVFALDGKPCGVLSQQSAVEGASDEDEETKRTVIFPLEAVLKSLEAARKKVPEVVARVAAERKAAAAAKEAEKDTPKDPATEPGKEPGEAAPKAPPPKEPPAPDVPKPGTEPAKPPEQPR